MPTLDTPWEHFAAKLLADCEQVQVCTDVYLRADQRIEICMQPGRGGPTHFRIPVPFFDIDSVHNLWRMCQIEMSDICNLDPPLGVKRYWIMPEHLTGAQAWLWPLVQLAAPYKFQLRYMRWPQQNTTFRIHRTNFGLERDLTATLIALQDPQSEVYQAVRSQQFNYGANP